MFKLPVVGGVAPPPPSTPLFASEIGSFRFRSKHERRLVRRLGQAIGDFSLVEEGDRVMVCLSGGKDSYALLDLLLLLKRRAPTRFEITAVTVDQGWPGYRTEPIAAHVASRGVPFRLVRAHEIAEVVERVLRPEETGATPCSLCSRLRRGVLYGVASELGATKIALGHHLDDLAETLLMNLFFSGSLRSMPPRMVSDDGRHVVIRPMAFIEEEDLIEYAAERRYPVVRCSCPTCGLPDQQRQVVKRLIATVKQGHPELKSHMLRAMRNVKENYLLDSRLYDQKIAQVVQLQPSLQSVL